MASSVLGKENVMERTHKRHSSLTPQPHVIKRKTPIKNALTTRTSPETISSKFQNNNNGNRFLPSPLPQQHQHQQQHEEQKSSSSSQINLPPVLVTNASQQQQPSSQPRRQRRFRGKIDTCPGFHDGFGLGLGRDVKHLPEYSTTFQKKTNITDNDTSNNPNASNNTQSNIANAAAATVTTVSRPHHYDVNIQYGLRDYGAGLYTSALSRFRKAIKNYPNQTVPRFLRGLCHDKLHSWEAALNDFTVVCDSHQTCSNNDGNNNNNTTAIGGSNGAAVGRGNSSWGSSDVTSNRKAKCQYERALAYFNRGVVHSKIYAFDNAIDDFGKAIELYDADVDFYYNRALLYRRFGQFEKAQHDYEMIRRLERGTTGITSNDRLSSRRLSSLKFPRLGNNNSRDDMMLEGGRSYNKGTSTNNDSVNKYRCSRAMSTTSYLSSVRPNTTASATITIAPSSSSSSSQEQQIQRALQTQPSKRTLDHLNLLVFSSKLMPAFRHFSETQLHTLWKHLYHRLYPAQTRLFNQGDVVDCYYVVWSGGPVSVRTAGASYDEGSRFANAMALGSEMGVRCVTAGNELDSFLVGGGHYQAQRRQSVSPEPATASPPRRDCACVTDDVTELLMLQQRDFDATVALFIKEAQRDKIQFLSTIKCFDAKKSNNHWTFDRLTVLAEHFREKVYKLGDTIHSQNERAKELYVIKSGLVSLLRTPQMQQLKIKRPQHQQEQQQRDRRRQPPCICIAKLCTGDVFGEASVLSSSPHDIIGSRDREDSHCHNSTYHPAVYPATAVCDTKTIVYITKIADNSSRSSSNDLWSLDARAALADATVNYVDDAILLRAERERRRRVKVLKRLKKEW